VPPLVSHSPLVCRQDASCVFLQDAPLLLHAFSVQDLASRPRRNRRSESFRKAVREQVVTPANFILPIFVHEEGTQNIPIASMPGIYRLAYGKNVIEHVAQARAVGVNQVVVFPKVGESTRMVLPGPHHSSLCQAHAWHVHGTAHRLMA
jgi:hypothetical protein